MYATPLEGANQQRVYIDFKKLNAYSSEAQNRAIQFGETCISGNDVTQVFDTLKSEDEFDRWLNTPAFTLNIPPYDQTPLTVFQLMCLAGKIQLVSYVKQQYRALCSKHLLPEESSMLNHQDRATETFLSNLITAHQGRAFVYGTFSSHPHLGPWLWNNCRHQYRASLIEANDYEVFHTAIETGHRARLKWLIKIYVLPKQNKMIFSRRCACLTQLIEYGDTLGLEILNSALTRQTILKLIAFDNYLGFRNALLQLLNKNKLQLENANQKPLEIIAWHFKHASHQDIIQFKKQLINAGKEALIPLMENIRNDYLLDIPRRTRSNTVP